MKSFLSLTIVLCLFTVCLCMRKQSIGVKGRLLCGTTPAANVRVKLFDEDDGIDPDDELDAGYTDSSGNFRLSGDTREFTTIDPVFKAYHDCNDGIVPCQRKWRIKLPKKYITKGKTPKEIMDIGVLNLEMEMPNEEHDFHIN